MRLNGLGQIVPIEIFLLLFGTFVREIVFFGLFESKRQSLSKVLGDPHVLLVLEHRLGRGEVVATLDEAEEHLPGSENGLVLRPALVVDLFPPLLVFPDLFAECLAPPR